MPSFHLRAEASVSHMENTPSRRLYLQTEKKWFDNSVFHQSVIVIIIKASKVPLSCHFISSSLVSFRTFSSSISSPSPALEGRGRCWQWMCVYVSASDCMEAAPPLLFHCVSFFYCPGLSSLAPSYISLITFAFPHLFGYCTTHLFHKQWIHLPEIQKIKKSFNPLMFFYSESYPSCVSCVQSGLAALGYAFLTCLDLCWFSAVEKLQHMTLRMFEVIPSHPVDVSSAFLFLPCGSPSVMWQTCMKTFEMDTTWSRCWRSSPGKLWWVQPSHLDI